jgi:hypothetical protein
MTAKQTSPPRTLAPSRRRLPEVARRGLARAVPPYARYRARQATFAATLTRLESELKHIRKRHTEQIERLEDFVRELVLTAEALRDEIARREDASRRDAHERGQV